MQQVTVTQTVALVDAREGLAVFGPQDRYLKLVQQETGSQIVIRDHAMVITGEPSQVDRLVRMYRVLLKLVRQGFHLSESDIAYALDLAERNMEKELLDLYSEELGVSVKGQVIRVKTLGQRQYIKAIRKRDIVFGIGPAGTGKTYLAVVMAVMALEENAVKRIVLTRPAVEAGESLGFLPGDLQEKVNPYLRPLYDALYDMLGTEQVSKLMDRGVIEVAPIAYMRGRTLHNAFIILDEAQNTTPEQMKMFLTRLGFGSKMVITGDLTQIDLPKGKKSGLKEAVRLLSSIEELAFIYFKEEDVIRHSLVQKIIQAYAREEQ